MRYRAYNAFNKDKSLEILFRPNPVRWMDNFVGNDNPIRDVANWSSEIKYLKDGKISDEIRNMPKDKGGIYMFYLTPIGEGGNLFFRPVGLLPFVSAVCQIMTTQKDYDYKTIIVNYASFLDRNVSSEFWAKILWDSSAKKMLVRNGSITKYLLIEMYSSDYLIQKDRNKMVERFVQLFGLANKNEAEEQIKLRYTNRIGR